jgi:hypothetical protein
MSLGPEVFMSARFRVGLRSRFREAGTRAVGLGVTAAACVGAQQADAAIIHVNPDDMTIRPGPNNNPSINLNLSGLINEGAKNPDFVLNFNEGNPVNLNFQSLNNAAEGVLNPLNFNDNINNENFGDGRSGTEFNLGMLNPINNNASGDWVGATNAYLGIRLDIPGGSPHFGWVELSVDDALNLSVHEFAVEDVANRPILAGATQSQDAPEPGTLGLLALGAVGIAVWRRRRAPA